MLEMLQFADIEGDEIVVTFDDDRVFFEPISNVAVMLNKENPEAVGFATELRDALTIWLSGTE